MFLSLTTSLLSPRSFGLLKWSITDCFIFHNSENDCFVKLPPYRNQGPTLTVAWMPGATKKKTAGKQNLPRHEKLTQLGKYWLRAQYRLRTARSAESSRLKTIKMDHFSTAMTATESRSWRAMLNPFHTLLTLRQKKCQTAPGPMDCCVRRLHVESHNQIKKLSNRCLSCR